MDRLIDRLVDRSIDSEQLIRMVALDEIRLDRSINRG